MPDVDAPVRTRWRSGVLLAAVAVALVGALGAGSGPRNGDAAVYAASALAGDFSERRLHLPYLWLGHVLLPIRADALDLLSTGCLAVAVGLLGLRSGAAAAWALAAASFVAAPFAEVEPVWVLLLVAAVTTPASVPAMAGAVCVSPTALLAVPWVATRVGWRAVWGAGLGALVVGAVAGPDAWLGDRGILGHTPMPGAALQAWAWGLGPLCLAVRDPRVLALLPLLFGPSDADVWLVTAVALALGRWSAATERLLPAAAIWGLVRAWDEVGAVREENARIEAVAHSMGPDDGLVAPWSVGVRASLVATGTPYDLQWRPPRGFVRDQQARWCGAPLARVVLWSPVEDPLEGCPAPSMRSGEGGRGNLDDAELGVGQ